MCRELGRKTSPRFSPRGAGSQAIETGSSCWGGKHAGSISAWTYQRAPGEMCFAAVGWILSCHRQCYDAVRTGLSLFPAPGETSLAEHLPLRAQWISSFCPCKETFWDWVPTFQSVKVYGLILKKLLVVSSLSFLSFSLLFSFFCSIDEKKLIWIISEVQSNGLMKSWHNNVDCIHSFITYLWSTCYLPGPVQGAQHASGNETDKNMPWGVLYPDYRVVRY